MYCFIFHSAYDTVLPAKGKAVVKTDIQIALPDGCYGRVGMRILYHDNKKGHLTLYQTLKFRLFQTGRVCRRQF